MIQDPEISIVVPVYNAKESLDELVQRIHESLGKAGKAYELILVDDASRDGSWKKILELKSQLPSNINGIRLRSNVGQHVATLCGFNFARGKYVITMDDDLQHDPEDIMKLVGKLQQTGADFVYGVFANKKHGLIRSTGSYVLRKSSKMTVGNVGDGSSFRCFSKDLADKVKMHFHSFVFIDELIYWYTHDIELVELEHHTSKKSKSGYSIPGLFGMMFDVVINYTAIPLRIMTYGGLLLSFLSFVAGIYFIVKKMYFKIDVPGFTATIVVILFSTSIILICFGIIGQYLYRLYHMQLGRPVFQIKERT